MALFLMIVTLPYLKERFERYNHQLFDDKLPMPTLKLSRAKTRLGQMSCKRKSYKEYTKYDHFTISISTAYDLSQDELDDIIIHEMIHYSITYTGIKDTSPHGKIFQEKMNAINQQYGRHISISAKRKNLAQKSTNNPTTFLVLALKMRNGKHFLSSVSPSYAREISSKLTHIQGIEQSLWYTTTNDFFCNMPRVRSLRGRLVSEEVYKEMTQIMTPLT